ncbi:hypothetical protein NIES4103_13390 [Nostoc sp. NIES-4103]|nr:hypothetical protein NIES4103_13390 [Nostoc sp. NIES-4103]
MGLLRTPPIALGNGFGCLVAFEDPENDHQENGNQHDRCDVVKSRMVLANTEQGWRGEEASRPVKQEKVRDVVGEVCADGKLGGAVNQ